MSKSKQAQSHCGYNAVGWVRRRPPETLLERVTSSAHHFAELHSRYEPRSDLKTTGPYQELTSVGPALPVVTVLGRRNTQLTECSEEMETLQKMVGQHKTVRSAASFCGTSYTQRLARGCITPGRGGKVMIIPKEGRLHIMLLPCITDDHFPEGLMNTRGIPMGTHLTIWITFATQPRPAHWDCPHNNSSGRLQQSAHSLSHHCKWNQFTKVRF